MSSEWRSFLTQEGAHWSTDQVLDFGDANDEARTAVDGNVIADLSHFALISVAGRDAQRLLQGQLTNDIRAVSDKRAQLSAWCDAKGRILVNFLVFACPQGYCLQLPGSLLATTLNRLQLYLLRAQAHVTDAGNQLVRIGLSGPEVSARLEGAVGVIPHEADDVVCPAELTIIRLRGSRPRFEVVGATTSVKELWRALGGSVRPVGGRAWSLLDILAGVPVILPETAGEFVPQMVNLDALSGVSFSKGCYTGQEIIARTQYLGKIKRRMVLAHAETEQRPEPGMPVVVSDGGAQRGVGSVVNAEAHPDGGWKLLVVLSTADANKAIHLPHADGAILRLEPLPYGVGDIA